MRPALMPNVKTSTRSWSQLRISWLSQSFMGNNMYTSSTHLPAMKPHQILPVVQCASILSIRWYILLVCLTHAIGWLLFRAFCHQHGLWRQCSISVTGQVECDYESLVHASRVLSRSLNGYEIFGTCMLLANTKCLECPNSPRVALHSHCYTWAKTVMITRAYRLCWRIQACPLPGLRAKQCNSYPPCVHFSMLTFSGTWVYENMSVPSLKLLDRTPQLRYLAYYLKGRKCYARLITCMLLP